MRKMIIKLQLFEELQQHLEILLRNKDSVVELIYELISRNKIVKKNLLSDIHFNKRFRCLFSCFNCEKCNELDSVAFLDCQQMYVTNDIDFCIRIMAQVLLPSNFPIQHPYLRGASKLRPDRC